MYDFIRRQKLNIATSISIIVLVLIYAVGASASTDNLFDNKSYDGLYTHNLPDDMLNSNGLQIYKGTTYKIEFAKPYNLQSIKYYFNSNYSATKNYVFTVVTSNGSVHKKTKTNDFFWNSININLSDVTSIEFYRSDNINNNYGYKISHFSVLGDFDLFEITGLQVVDKSHDNLKIKWQNPKKILPTDKIVVYQNGKKIKTLDSDQSSLFVNNLKPQTDYTYRVAILRDSGMVTDGETIEVTTDDVLIVPQEITNVTATPTYDRVDLSWTLPSNTNFKHVNIYRDVEKGLLKNMFGAIDPTPVVHAASDDTKIFETNGTYFNDLTVKPDTKYKYKLTTTTTDGQESKGITTSVKTLKKPTPKPPKTEIEVNDNDDYVVKWTQDKGAMKIFVGDKLYATVEASKGSHTIPRDDMVYNWLDQPQIKVVWVDEDGDESESAVPGLPGTSEGGMPDIGLVNPISALDVTTNVFDFLRILSPYLLIAMLIRLAVQIINVIRYRVLINRKHERRAREEEMYGDYRNRYGDSD